MSKGSRDTMDSLHHDNSISPLRARTWRTAVAVKRELQIYAGERPAIFFKYHQFKRNPLAVQPKTQLVIEGFPRSANTFSVWAFRHAQCEDVRLAHHLHYPAQVVRAAQWQIPLLVLIRKPEDAVVSLLMRTPLLMPDQALRHYISFYRCAAKYREAFVLGHFEEVVEDYGVVIERLNDKFGTRFSVFEHTEENVENVYSSIEKRHRSQYGERVVETHVARPSAAKKEIRSRVRGSLDASKQRKLLAEAMTVYDDLTTD